MGQFAISLLFAEKPQTLWAKANPCFRDNYELVMQPVCMRLEKPLKNGNLVAGPLVGKAQEYHSSVRAPLSVDFLAEVLVVSNENPVLVGRLRDDVIVVHSTRFVVDREDFVLLSAQPVGYH